MELPGSFAFVIYISCLLTIGYFSYRRRISEEEFIIGGRSLSSTLTALAAHASDMSSWLFLAYPATLFSGGLVAVWTALGLTVCMWLNWQWIAPKIRYETEKLKSLTLSSFFEKKFHDTSGRIRLFSAIILIVFYTVYISAFLIGLGDLLTSLFPLHYGLALGIGMVFVLPYVLIGGYITLAWIDLFQGCFLLAVILAVPLYLLPTVGGISGIVHAMQLHHLPLNIVPDVSVRGIITIVSMALGWGLGYFGQPHIVTKFMGIRKVDQLAASKWIGMSWMVLSLGGATLVGLVGIPLFQGALANPETLFIQMVKSAFTPFLAGLILCAVLGATINTLSSQVLVLTSTLAEDLYKKFFRPGATSEEIVRVSRGGIIVIASIAFLIAYQKTSTIYTLVNYAWSGIGASFGPLVIASLHFRKINRYGAWSGILGGGIISALWPLINQWMPYTLFPMIPAFIVSLFLIVCVSRWTHRAVA